MKQLVLLSLQVPSSSAAWSAHTQVPNMPELSAVIDCSQHAEPTIERELCERHVAMLHTCATCANRLTCLALVRLRVAAEHVVCITQLANLGNVRLANVTVEGDVNCSMAPGALLAPSQQFNCTVRKGTVSSSGLDVNLSCG
jgi:hypothetical protein